MADTCARWIRKRSPLLGSRPSRRCWKWSTAIPPCGRSFPKPLLTSTSRSRFGVTTASSSWAWCRLATFGPWTIFEPLLGERFTRVPITVVQLTELLDEGRQLNQEVNNVAQIVADDSFDEQQDLATLRVLSSRKPRSSSSST